MSTGRNDPCLCGSGKKYKHCCLGKGDPAVAERTRKAGIVVAVALAVALVCGLVISQQAGFVAATVGLLGAGVWYWFTEPPPTGKGGADPSAINFGR